MASKKYMLIIGFLCLFGLSSYAQRNDAATYWGDSSKIATKNMPQYNEFMNNQYPYPAKPRSMWELGLSVGPSFILGDIDPRLGYVGGISLRKAFSHTLSLRFGYTGSMTYGLDYKPRSDFPADGTTGANPWGAYNPFGAVANFRNATHEFYTDLVVSLNTLSFYRGNPKVNWYALGGYSLVVADVDVNARNASGGLYNFASINYSRPRSDIKSDLRNMMDDTYESNAPVRKGNRENFGRNKNNQLLRHGFNFGMGVAFKFSPKFNLGLEQRWITASDNLDGLVGGRGNDYYSQTTLRLNFNLGNAAKRVEPLWWINPNNYVYNELNAPKHMKLPTPVLPDADGDGVTDQFDLEPNTPAGCPVDTHGVSKDTDGDGVPDCRDKELLTQQKCFPVNADGVGNCPEPDCCKELRDKLNSGAFNPKNDCAIGDLPSIQFKSGTTSLSSDAQSMLNSVAQRINANPNCNIRVIGYGAADKRAQQLSWDRVNAVIKYLVEKQGVSEGRLIFSYGQDGDSNTVDLQGTTEQGPNTVPAPHPNLRKGK